MYSVIAGDEISRKSAKIDDSINGYQPTLVLQRIRKPDDDEQHAGHHGHLHEVCDRWRQMHGIRTGTIEEVEFYDANQQ